MGGGEAVETTNDEVCSLGDGDEEGRLEGDSNSGYVAATVGARLKGERRTATAGGRELGVPEVEGGEEEATITERGKDGRGRARGGRNDGDAENGELVKSRAGTALVK